jgi:hypothetical protein
MTMRDPGEEEGPQDGAGQTSEDPRAELERLRAENERLRRTRSAGGLTFKVSEKGAVSVYGLGRFPVTLYLEQWEKLLSQAEELRQFIADNINKLKRKPA